MNHLTVEDRHPLLVAAGELFAGDDPPPPGSPPRPLVLAALAGAQAALSPATSERTMARAGEALRELIEERGRLATEDVERRFEPLIAAAERFSALAGDGEVTEVGIDALIAATRAVA